MIKKSIVLGLILVFVITFCGTVSAAPGDTIYVNDSGGSDSNNGSSWLTAKKTILNATASVNENGTVNIANGEYKGFKNTNITINKNMNIVGQNSDASIINGTGVNWIFYINSKINLTITNLTLSNGKRDDGGAIYNHNGTVTIINSILKDNTAILCGGAIFNGKGNIIIIDSKLLNNNASQGGAIYNNENNTFITIDNSNITKNYAVHGGAIFNNDKKAIITINNSTMLDNNATQGGSINNYLGTVNINNSTVNGNNANDRGGAIYNQNGILILIKSNLNSNNATKGGGIYNGGNLTLIDSNLTFNTVSASGGGIWNDANATINDSYIQENTANNGHGGGIVNYYGNLNINDSIIDLNTASGLGGGIYNAVGTLNVEGCTITNNTSLGYNSGGGGIYNHNGTVTVSNSNLTGNSAASGGGVYNYGTILLTGSNFNHNTAVSADFVQGGGGIYNAATFMSISTATITNCSIEQNLALQNAGGICNYGIININRTNINNNSAYRCGGIFNGYGGNLTVKGCNINYNTQFNDGAIYNLGIANVNFNRIVGNAVSYGNGDAIYNNGTINASLNWWGSNVGPTSSIVNTLVTPWIVLTGTFNPESINENSNAIINLVLLHDNGILTDLDHPDLYYHNLTDDLPDEIPVTFFTTIGSISGISNFIKGNAQATLNGGSINGTADVSAIVDNQTMHFLVNVDTITPTVWTNIPSGLYNSDQTVILNMDEEGTIYYTIDGTVPSNISSIYNSPLIIQNNTILKFFAMDKAGNPSEIHTETYNIDKVTPTASADLTSGIYNTNKNVDLSMNEDGSIYYTIDGTIPSTNSTKYTSTIPITTTTTIKYFAMDLAGNPSPIYVETYTIDKLIPTTWANIHSGSYNTTKTIILNMDEEGTIYYTINGTEPSNTSNIYNNPLVIENSIILKFFAIDNANNPSEIITETYILDYTTPQVSVNIPSGLYNLDQTVILNIDEQGKIYYTINGTDPSNTSLIYKNPLLIENNTILKFFGVDEAGNPSDILTENYSIDKTNPLVNADVKGGLFNSIQYINLNMNEEGRIYYTINGENPSNNSNVYNGTIVISTTSTLKFFGVDEAGNPSSVCTETYTIDKITPSAYANVKSGLYNTNKVVSLSMSEIGNIYYTLNGATPTNSSTKYTGPITIASTATLRFIAFDNAGNPSPVYTAIYTIDKTAPKLISTYPKRYATGVSRTATMYIKFSEKLKASVNWSKIVVKNKYGKAVSISKWISNNVLYIKTSSKRSSYSYYTIYIPASAIKDYAGNNFADGYIIKFKTGR